MACTVSNVVAHPATALSANVSRQIVSVPNNRCVASRRCLTVRATASGQDGTVQIEKGKDSAVQKSRPGPQPMRRRRESPLLLLDSWDPFSAGSLRQMMDMMDQFFVPETAASSAQGTARGAMRTPWDVVEAEEAYYIRVDMPGFGKEDVKVYVEEGVLVVSGERDPQGKEDERWAAKSYRKFSTRLTLPDNVSVDKIKAELKNGVLSITVPKIKPEERKQVIDVQVS